VHLDGSQGEEAEIPAVMAAAIACVRASVREHEEEDDLLELGCAGKLGRPSWVGPILFFFSFLFSVFIYNF
jgi:hypothetical protein